MQARHAYATPIPQQAAATYPNCKSAVTHFWGHQATLIQLQGDDCQFCYRTHSWLPKSASQRTRYCISRSPAGPAHMAESQSTFSSRTRTILIHVTHAFHDTSNLATQPLLLRCTIVHQEISRAHMTIAVLYHHIF